MPVLKLCRMIAHYFINRIDGYINLDKWCITFRPRCVEARETPCLRPCLRVRRYLANVSLFLLVKQAQTRLIQYSLIVIHIHLSLLPRSQPRAIAYPYIRARYVFKARVPIPVSADSATISALPPGVRDKRAFLDA
jgi:hypothetical protein